MKNATDPTLYRNLKNPLIICCLVRSSVFSSLDSLDSLLLQRSRQNREFQSFQNSIQYTELPGTPRPTIYKWLFQLDDSQSLHRKWLEITKHLFINGCLGFQVYLCQGWICNWLIERNTTKTAEAKMNENKGCCLRLDPVTPTTNLQNHEHNYNQPLLTEGCPQNLRTSRTLPNLKKIASTDIKGKCKNVRTCRQNHIFGLKV